ncbi:MAG: VWA domain-containing protein [Verrucomicrobia bacterium]|nr:VWA domain-containing protein [Verrucomicrobiota bacterium]
MTVRPPDTAVRGFIRWEFLLLLGLLPLAVWLFLGAERKRRAALLSLSGPRGLARGILRQRRIESACLLGAVVCLILALARPTWSETWIEPSGEGRDIVFLLDVSRSMLASDAAPSRLESAKTAIRDVVRELTGDRLALVAFSGSASILCPLTTDLAFFQDKLEEAHPDFIPAGEVRVGGTRIGDAIRKATEKLFTAERRGYQDLILITDGEDQQSAPEATVSKLSELGVCLITIGVGDSMRGSRIPAPAGSGAEFVRHGGAEVWTRLESRGLEALAGACPRGVYLEAGTRVLPLGKIYPRLVQHLGRKESAPGERLRQGREIFPVFLGLALFLLALPWRPRRWAEAAAFAMVLFAPMPPAMAAEDPVKLFRRGQSQVQAKNHANAAASFLEAAQRFPEPRRRMIAVYNAGLSAFLQGVSDEELDPQSAAIYFGQAINSFRACLGMHPEFGDAAFNLELALAREARAAARVAEKQKPPVDKEKAPEEPGEKEKKESAEGQKSEAESDDEGEGEKTREEGEGEATPASESKGSNSLDLEAKDLPPPMVEPEELFRQESQQGELRQKQRSTQYKPVEKDW